MNRQFTFSEKDIGLLKTKVLKQALIDRNSNVKVDTLELKVNKDNINNIPKSNIIILSADSLGIVKLINGYSLKNKIPYLNIGYILDIVAWGPFVIPNQSSCFLCQIHNNIANEHVDQELMELANKINQNFQQPSNGFVNTLAATFGVMDIVKYLGNFGKIESLNKRIGLHTNSLKWEIQNWDKNPKCICNKFN